MVTKSLQRRDEFAYTIYKPSLSRRDFQQVPGTARGQSHDFAQQDLQFLRAGGRAGRAERGRPRSRRHVRWSSGGPGRRPEDRCSVCRTRPILSRIVLFLNRPLRSRSRTVRKFEYSMVRQFPLPAASFRVLPRFHCPCRPSWRSALFLCLLPAASYPLPAASWFLPPACCCNSPDL